MMLGGMTPLMGSVTGCTSNEVIGIDTCAMGVPFRTRGVVTFTPA
jgi:hypothetical protein